MSGGWTKVSLRKVAELKNGYAFKSQQYAASGPYRVITISNVQDGRLDATTCKYIHRLPHDMKDFQMLKNGEILVSMTGNVGRVCKVSESGFLLNQRVGKIISISIDNDFLYSVLSSDSFREEMIELGQGGAQPNLSVGDILDYAFECPSSLAEQRKIAAILRTWDEAIETAEAELKAKQERKRGLMQMLLNPSAEGAGTVRKEYDTVKLGEIAEFSKGKGLPKSAIVANGRHKCVHYGELFTFYGDQINEVISRTDDFDAPALSVEGDILMPTSDVTPAGLAKASCIPESNVILGGDILVIRPDRNRVHPEFLSTYIRFKKKEVLRLAKGTTVFHLYGSDMAKFLVQLPLLAEQCKITLVLQEEDRGIGSLKAKVELLRTQKRGLMQKLLTGEVRVAA